MERNRFHRLLREATAAVVAFTRGMVKDQLPDGCVYRVLLNQSWDLNPLVADEGVFPEDSMLPGRFLGTMTNDEATDLLWRQGQVPEWVDVSVAGVRQDRTVIELRCRGRFTASEGLLYYAGQGTGPFGLKKARRCRPGGEAWRKTGGSTSTGGREVGRDPHDS